MSLINEALKRVSEADRGKPQKQDFEMRAMQPAAYERRISPVLWVTVPALILAIGIGLGGLLLAKLSQRQSLQAQVIPLMPKTSVADSSAPAPAEASKPAAPVVATQSPAAVEQPKPQPAPEPAPAPIAQVAAPAPTPAPAPVATPAPPTFRLKGILYSKNPTALINNSSIQVGGEIDGATVTKIDRTSVTLEQDGKTTVLRLGAQ
jgi:outer membrane biosynthesis protein TonB